MKPAIFLAPCLALLVTACAEVRPQEARQDTLSAECALLAEASVRMAAAGTPAHDGLAEGCPGVAARDIRPLPEQMASLRAATAAAPPPSVSAGSRAETVFRRMITRGVAPAIATELTTTEAFRQAAR